MLAFAEDISYSQNDKNVLLLKAKIINIYVIPKSNKKLQTFPLCLQNSFLSKQYEPTNCRFDWQTEYWNLIGCGQNNRNESCLQSGVSISVVKTLVNGGYTSRLTLWLSTDLLLVDTFTLQKKLHVAVKTIWS